MKVRPALGVAALAAAGSFAIAPAAVANVSTHYAGTLADGATWIADVPSDWNGTLLLYSHGFGPTTAADAPAGTASALLASGYALAGSSYDPNGSMWALDSAVRDQFQTLAAVESGVLPSAPHQVLALGTSMGRLVSALEAQNGAGRIDGALTTCGIVAGAVNLNNYQLDGEYALAQLLLPGQQVQLTGFADANAALATAAKLQAAAATAQQTPAGRARLALAMAFLNAEDGLPSPVLPDPVTLEADQYQAEFTGSFSTLDFIESGRPSIDAADGGNASWNAGVDYAAELRRSPYLGEVAALYRDAGISPRISLGADLANLTANANITADPAAVASLRQTSVPTGRLEVPELDMHTISDQLVPVQQEDFYLHQVRAAGSGDLLRQAYVASVGHCNFSTGEIEAGVMALAHRLTSGRWGSVAAPSSLNQVASSLGQGPARFIHYRPGPLTGATAIPSPP